MNKRLLLKRLLYSAALLLTIGVFSRAQAQVYLTENFDGTFTGTPSAPTNWTQSRFNLWSDGTPAAINVAGPKDWEQNVSTGTSWSKPGFATPLPASVSGNGVLWIEDYYFGTTTNALSRRMESPSMNLSSSTSPYVKFKYWCSQTSNYTYPLIVVASNDNGQTWKSIMHVQPNAPVPATGTAAAGSMVATTPWSNIIVRIPDAYKVSNAKIGLVRNAAYSFASNLYIDSLSVEEFTPTPIISAASGLWSNPSTWVGGVVPDANNNVIVDVGHTVEIDVNIARAQNVTVNGTLRFYSSSTSQVLQTFGDLTVNTGGTYSTNTTGSTTVSRWTYIGKSLFNDGTLTVNGSTATTLFFSGGSPATYSGAGTITGGMVPSVYFGNSGGFTFNSPLVLRNSVFLIEGPVAPNGNLTVGLTGNDMTITRNARGFFTSRPIYPSLGTSTRNVYYGGTTNGNMQQAILGRDTIFTGFECDSVSNGEQLVLGTLTINTMDHIRTTAPLRVGNATLGGATTFSRGIVFTSAANPLIISQLGNGATGATPSTTNPPTTQGSYVVGPVRMVRGAANSTSATVPLGVGGSYLQSTVNSNHLKTVILAPGATWNNQQITFSIVSPAGGTVDTGLTTLMGDKFYYLDLNNGNDLGTNATLTLRAQNYTLGNSDNISGNQNQLFIGQAPALTGSTWKRRSVASGTTTAFVNNTVYTFTSATVSPFGPIAPLANNGSYFGFVSNAGLMAINSAAIQRNTNPVSPGTSNNVMLRIRLTATGQVPKDLTQMVFSTAGTNNLAALTGARVYFTGSDSNFSVNSTFGSLVTTLGTSFTVNGTQTISAGDNYFWLVYNVSGTANLGDSLSANLTSYTFNSVVANPTAPAAGYRIVSSPMTYVSASADQVVLSKIEQGATNGQILNVQVNMSATGAPVALTQIALNTNGTFASPATSLANAKLYFTGSSNSFATTNLVGTTLAPNGAFVINGNVNLVNGANYFWVTYDLLATAPVGDSVDCEISGLTVNGIAQTLASAPAGSRMIRAPYCPSNATTTADGEILGVQINSFNNVSTCATTGTTGSILNQYSNFTNLGPITLVAGLANTFSVHTATCGGQFTGYMSIFIDYNNDGDFVDAGENVHTTPAFTYGLNVYRTGTFTVPCNANPGLTRMRVILVEGSVPTPCITYGYGETEDYTVNIVASPPSFTNATAIQVTGTTSTGATDVPVLRVPVKVVATPCLPGVITELRFNTAGTTTAGDILAAKLYKTGNSGVFTNSNLLGTVTSPNGQFVFNFVDTVSNDTNNYWLAYDVAGTAANNNLLDARFDSVQAFGSYYSPLVGSPAGSRVVAAPMTYISSDAIHTTTSKVETGTTNNQMLRIVVNTSAVGAPISLTQFNLSTNGGGIDTSNIAGIKVWYTGNSSTFATTTQFGTTFVPVAVGASFNVTGIQPLANGANYFWVTYDIKGVASAIIGDSVDCEVNGIDIASITRVPTTTAPAGSRIIRQPYCASSATTTFDGEILGVTINSTTNNSTCSTTGGPGSVQSQYSDYTGLTPINIVAGLANTFSIHTATCGGNFTGYVSIFIDYNNDGDFTDPGENAHTSPSFTYGLNVFRTGSFVVPCTAVGGLTRMRVVMVEGAVPTPCGTYGYGETEDYTVNIISAPPVYQNATTLQITGTTSAGATDVAVLRVPVKVIATPCIPGVITEMRFNTSGTTTAADILTAKLYKTGASAVFNNSNLLGTVTAPSGQFVFNFVDTVANDTNNYWLAYDVAATAANNNVLDARFDSVQAFGAYYAPIVSSPAGSITISTPMTYISSNAIHTSLSKVETGSVNNQLLRVVVNTSATGAPINLTQFALSTNGGGIDTSNISAIKVWYTGNSSTFATTSQFGTTFVPVAVGASFNVTGIQPLTGGANYFWVTYDIKGVASAIIGDSVDCEVTGIDIASITRVPTTTAPVGARVIRQPYCPSSATTTFDGEILGVTINSVTNNSTCASTGGPGSVQNQYSDYTGLTPINVVAGLANTFSIHTATCGGNFTGYVSIFVDFNNDGDFTDPGENAHTSPSFTYGLNVFRTGTFMVPCTATPGLTRMRVVMVEGMVPSACGTYGYGETEDYTVNIISQPASYTTSLTEQITGSVGAGSTDIPVLRIPVKVVATPCVPGIISELRFNTAGTTSAADIASAKLYKTGSSGVFSNNNLVGTVTSPSGQFSFLVADTAINDTNFYWLAYDVSATAANGNLLDARFDSIQAFGNWYVPTVSAPAGSRIVAVPMTFISTTTAHPDLSAVEQSSINNPMLRVDVVTSSAGAPINVTQFDLSTNGGGIDTSNIAGIKVYYSGAIANPTSAQVTQFGTTYVPTATGAYAVTGTQALLNGTNYFWVVYDIKSNAIIGDSVDAEMAGVTVAGVSRIPTVSAPLGARKIRAPYCPSLPSSTADEEIWNVTLGTLNNTTNCSSVGGPGSILQRYNNYTELAAPILYKGGSYSLSLNLSSCGGNYGAWGAVYIDFNGDGDFFDANELVYSTGNHTSSNLGQLFSGQVVVPTSASTGKTRMRVIYSEQGTLPTPCQAYTWGETEDYSVDIQDAPFNNYVWTGSTSNVYTLPANWSPVRTLPNMNDKLVFNSTSPITITGVATETVRVMEVTNGTIVNLAGTGNTLSVSDTLSLGNNARVRNGANFTLASGKDTVATGVLLVGTGSGVNGNFARWFNSTTGQVSFPLIDTAGTTREVTVQYTVGATQYGSLTASFVNAIPGNAGLPVNDPVASVTATRAGVNGYWSLLPNGINGGEFTGTFNASGFTGVNSYTGLFLMRRSGNATNWAINGTHVTTAGSNAAPVLSRTNMTQYGQYGVGGDTLVNTLPVTLVMFKASNAAGDVNLNWATSTEINNKGFFIERSLDGEKFEEIGFVTGKGNSKTTVNYASVDYNAFARTGLTTLYYRLRQVDFDGAFAYSNVVAVSEEDLLNDEVSVFPNPFVSQVSVNIEASNAGAASVSVLDMQGRVISTESLNVVVGSNYHEIKNLSKLSGGMYFVRVSQGGLSKTIKVTKTN
ncbi:MAG: GEVED domain-containing protein [Bacteroidetes bacterium]|nr:GEVED domain-containing protein [Bacteroidota bacterium]